MVLQALGEDRLHAAGHLWMRTVSAVLAAAAFRVSRTWTTRRSMTFTR